MQTVLYFVVGYNYQRPKYDDFHVRPDGFHITDNLGHLGVRGARNVAHWPWNALLGRDKAVVPERTGPSFHPLSLETMLAFLKYIMNIDTWRHGKLQVCEVYAEHSHMYEALYHNSLSQPCHYRGFFGYNKLIPAAQKHMDSVLMLQRQSGRLQRFGIEATSYLKRIPKPWTPALIDDLEELFQDLAVAPEFIFQTLITPPAEHPWPFGDKFGMCPMM